MNADDHVPVVRRFCRIVPTDDDSDEQEVLAVPGYRDLKTWAEIDKGYRSVILAEAGAGKTWEMQVRAKTVEQQGHPAFFLRIEDIRDAFEDAFEVGNEESFTQWLDSQDDAWFYLDSVDEARLDNPTTFERAIRRFSKKIRKAQLRAHVCISSRPYAWRPKSDREMVQRYLPFKKPRTEHDGKSSGPSHPNVPDEDALEVLVLQPLEEDDIRLFAAHRSAPEVDRLIQELARSNLMALAGRPFDLEEILSSWNANQSIGGRRELLHQNIERRLREGPDRATRQPLSPNKARHGARTLAAAVVLTGERGIWVPDNAPTRSGIDAESVLADWEPREVRDLLERAVFDDTIYGAVRFRHRDVRELLAAEWFSKLLQKGHSRHAIEALIFRDQYGMEILSPRLRPVLPWLILDDRNIRKRVLEIHPEVAVEGGDPARLPLPERKKILADILWRIVRDEDEDSTRDNAAIARIAQPDLGPDTKALIHRHADNDDAISFLARLVWQGEMSSCVPPLLDSAAEPAHGDYARVMAARAVMTCGTDAQKSTLWNRLQSRAGIPRRLLAEIVRDADPNAATVTALLASLDKLASPKGFEVTGLTQALHGFIERLPSPLHADADHPLAMLIAGLDGLVHQPPFVEPGEYDVSKRFAWLLDPAIHAVNRIVSQRTPAAMQSHAMRIMLTGPSSRRWLDHQIHDYKDELGDLIPTWPELNDALFWANVGVARIGLERKGKMLNDDLPVHIQDHYWSFGRDSFPRAIHWVKSRDSEDDRLVALSLAFRIYRYTQTEEPAEQLEQLRAAVNGNAVLSARLNELLNWTSTEEVQKWQRQEAKRQRRRKAKLQKQEQQRLDWIEELKANPGVVRHPPGLKPSAFSQDQYWLLREIGRGNLQTNQAQGADWRSLIDDFGEDVALAYRDAAMAHWRHYTPGLRSEGADTKHFLVSITFAMAGLQIEADEVDGFPTHLSESEVRLALRYMTRELNGFPRWLEAMHRARPSAVLEAVETELFWELANTEPDEPMHYILQDLAHYAPWLHGALVEPLLTWLSANDPPNDDTLRHILRILKGGCRNSPELATLAVAKASQGQCNEHRPYWYAIWVDAVPETGVVAVERWLATLDPEERSRAAQLCITALIGNWHSTGSGPAIGNFRTPRHLKSLYVLMHNHIREEEDIDRVGGGIYSPELRDDAQDARDALFQMLSELSGKEAYVALTQLIKDHPNPRSRPWMARQANKRARLDGDLEPWTADQVREFGASLTRTPTTQRQLFDLAISRITDLKHWLERGDDSPYLTWRRARTENEIRNLVAGWLNQNWGNPFTTAQEPELANRQRMDIWLQHPDVPFPVPIELKLLDKDWSGPKLCERLRNQLVGDYLREGTERCGLMLIVWQGSKPGRRWQIGNRRVGVSDLGDALKNYWTSISNRFSSTAAIEVVVIDLTLRGTQSGQEYDQ